MVLHLPVCQYGGSKVATTGNSSTRDTIQEQYQRFSRDAVCGRKVKQIEIFQQQKSFLSLPLASSDFLRQLMKGLFGRSPFIPH